MMVDLVAVTTWTCATNMRWTTEVTGSKGDVYTVRFGASFHEGPQYDWSCDCAAFRFHAGYCKHIEQVRASDLRCGWNAELEPTETCDHRSDGEPCCPDCGGPVEPVRVGV